MQLMFIYKFVCLLNLCVFDLDNGYFDKDVYWQLIFMVWILFVDVNKQNGGLQVYFIYKNKLFDIQYY